MASDALELWSEMLGPLPVINHFLSRMGLSASLDRFVPHDDGRNSPARASVVAMHIAAADAAGFYPNQKLPRRRHRHRQIHQVKLLLLHQQQGFHAVPPSRGPIIPWML